MPDTGRDQIAEPAADMAALVTITLPDGSQRQVRAGTTGHDVAAEIGTGLAKAALAMRVDGELCDLKAPLTRDAAVAIVTAKDEADALELIRHDFAHVLAEAVQALYPGTQITFGPTTADGFYYDFAPKDRPFTEEDLPAIEDKMRAIIRADKPLRREVWERADLIARWQRDGEAFKAEWAGELPEGEEISVYWSGDDWMDMCRGPHLPSTGKLDPDAFKLTKVAGAYWRGDADREMLSRIYGTAWRTKKELKAYLHRLEEAERRDHRKLGRELDLFHLQEEAQGSIFWHPKGYRMWLKLEQYMRNRQRQGGYHEIKTPQVLDSKFWRLSGHWDKFRENMFVVPDVVPSSDSDELHIDPDAKMMALKPMNCPAHVQVFKQGIKSYRDLPLRLSEFGCCHRNESHGGLHGLMRVRQMTQDDGHIFCREDQISQEAVTFCRLLEVVYGDLGFDDVAVKLATRPEVRAGEDDVWDRAEAGLSEALDAAGLDYEVAPGEGAFYGPKLEFHLRDAIGRSWQCGTLQLDFVMPQRLDAEYVGEDGAKHRPVMLHRAMLGSLERFLGILIEHYAGAMPMWLAPTQVVVATITDDAADYACEVAEAARNAGLEVDLDLRNEKINFKVREHSHQKVPAILVCGKREAESRTVNVRRFGAKDQTEMPLDQALKALAEEARTPGM
ncbi:threonyl-tRNA synthetase [Rhodothalassium salexigens DSM 2132]|uniref:Threonine--tRNA ligase n=2 Tax=Rhodothalassium salexigens TaxID=1086 RepID=A0A4R2PD37_RHOSA|nr:threonine--tRNA ligase [Rhodothalassium salexigens]MBB4212123.1 threonyl-tRNA synthetase [Rhodothalassium salexigens DSM 2132]TCP32997.1 threonyl-tRNA synthetase [Rhodothalassium salexigens DSM 2132]